MMEKIKNKKNILKLEIFNTLLIIILGTILHFTYNLSSKNKIVGLFSSVNESTWEHLKLIFYPTLLTIIIGYFITKNYIKNYVYSKCQGLLLSIVFIPIFYYTYTGILGINIMILDISSFIIATILGQYYSYKKMNTNNCKNYESIQILIGLLLCFTIFTFYPPHINLFKDPKYNTYGITN